MNKGESPKMAKNVKKSIKNNQKTFEMAQFSLGIDPGYDAPIGANIMDVESETIITCETIDVSACDTDKEKWILARRRLELLASPYIYSLWVFCEDQFIPEPQVRHYPHRGIQKHRFEYSVDIKGIIQLIRMGGLIASIFPQVGYIKPVVWKSEFALPTKKRFKHLPLSERSKAVKQASLETARLIWGYDFKNDHEAESTMLNAFGIRQRKVVIRANQG